MIVNTGEWVCIDIAADSGACDSVMPMECFCEMMKIHPSVQSARVAVRGRQRRVPCLGGAKVGGLDRSASALKGMAIQVADLHKPLLSLSGAQTWGSSHALARHMAR